MKKIFRTLINKHLSRLNMPESPFSHLEVLCNEQPMNSET